jgi:dihydroflavonol-4-reductase
VHFSSIHALCQEPLTSPIDENRPYAESRKYPPYDRSKAAGEKEVLKGIEKGLDAIIINPTGIIGPYDFRPSHSGELLLTLARHKLPALIKGGFNWVDVRDVVEGAQRAEQRAATGSRYLLSGHWASAEDIALKVEEITGAKPPKFNSPIWLARLGAPFMTAYSRLTGKRPLYTAVSLKALKSNKNISHAKATHDLDYNPRPFHDTIADSLQWFKDFGMLA